MLEICSVETCFRMSLLKGECKSVQVKLYPNYNDHAYKYAPLYCIKTSQSKYQQQTKLDKMLKNVAI